MIQVPIANAYAVRIPQVTRYMAKRHVDAFFADGSLRLTPLSLFRQHPDEVRRDVLEGRPAVEVRHPKIPPALFTFQDPPGTPYVFCGSLVEDASMADRFNEEHGVHVLDPVKFFGAISFKIPGVFCGVMGSCNYTEANGEADPTPFAALHDLPLEAFELAVQNAFDGLGRNFYDGLFRKPIRYRPDAEFRFIWFSKERHDEPLIVQCPEAAKFCRPFPRRTGMGLPEKAIAAAVRAAGNKL